MRYGNFFFVLPLNHLNEIRSTMKPVLRKISLQSGNSFSFQHYSAAHFYNYWHYHPELELVLIREGYGTRMIGDNIEPFKSGELVLIGANLPHLWRSDNACHHSESISIHLLEHFAGKDFISMPEMRNIRNLFQRAQHGIIFEPRVSAVVSEMLLEVYEKKEEDRLIQLLSLFKILAESTDTRLLSKIGANTLTPPSDTARINQVYAYVLTHFSENITVESMAEVANLSTTSFCRYFKKCANRTFVDFLMEIRIGYACKLLIETDKTIGQICQESGYNSISNFNNFFKKATKMTPSAYQKQFRKNG